VDKVSNADVLIISGSLGAGKTTVMSEASDLLCAAGVDHAAIDLDTLTIGHLLHAASLTRRNLAAIWHNYAAFGIRRVLLAGAIETAARLDEVRDAIPGAHIVVCRLRASVRTMQERVRWREPGMLQAELIERVSVLDAELDAAALHDFVVENDERPVTDVAREVLSMAGWPGGAPAGPGVPVKKTGQA